MYDKPVRWVHNFWQWWTAVQDWRRAVSGRKYCWQWRSKGSLQESRLPNNLNLNLQYSAQISQSDLRWNIFLSIPLTSKRSVTHKSQLTLFRAMVKVMKKRSQDRRCLSGLDFSPEQLFWVSYAHSWCDFNYDCYAGDEGGDVHAAAPWRVNVVLANMPEFARDFNCPVGSRLNPEKRCIVW